MQLYQLHSIPQKKEKYILEEAKTLLHKLDHNLRENLNETNHEFVTVPDDGNAQCYIFGAILKIMEIDSPKEGRYLTIFIKKGIQEYWERLSDETKNLLGNNELKLLKSGAILVIGHALIAESAEEHA